MILFNSFLRASCFYIALTALLFGNLASARSQDQIISRSQFLWKRLTLVQPTVQSGVFQEIIKLVGDKKEGEAIDQILNQTEFLQGSAKSWASTYSTLDFASAEAIDDLQITFIGATRDELDARTLLTDDYLYAFAKEIYAAPPTENHNDHYLIASTKNPNYLTTIVKRTDLYPSVLKKSGILTSRAFASLYLFDGTNRRPIEGIFNHFMCSPIQEWRDTSVSDQRIRP